MSALGAVLAQVETDDAVGSVVLTGAGGAFSAGGDVKGMAAASADRDAAGRRRGPVTRRRHPPSAAQPARHERSAVGHAQADDRRHRGARGRRRPVAGPGLRPAVRGAGSGADHSFRPGGFAGDYGGTWFLTRLVGSSKAKELYYFSERLSAEDAERLGIVNAIFPAADFEREVMARAPGWPPGRRSPTAT